MTTRESIDKTIDDLRTLIERAVRDEQLRHQLTGLPNASALDEHVQRAIDEGESFWLAFIEIDKFKTINDRFGYQRADALLCEVAGALEQAAPRFFADQASAFMPTATNSTCSVALARRSSSETTSSRSSTRCVWLSRTSRYQPAKA